MEEKKEIRIWVDGCFDMTHFGHANAIRQAKKLGDKLVVGVHSDEEVTKFKRPPILTQDERCKLLGGIKWVDEVVKNAPYVTSSEVMDENDCKYCAHGDDISTAEGKDVYDEIKKSGRYLQYPRTQGISTTGLIKRILARVDQSSEKVQSSYTGSTFFPTTSKFAEFSNGKLPKVGDKIVYTAGVFDLFHVGHLDFLEKAKALGDFLYVGVLQSSNSVMDTFERAMNLLACKYVDDIVFEPPQIVSKDLIEHFKIDIVCHGKGAEEKFYEIPKEKGIFRVIDSGNDMTTDQIIERVIENQEIHKKRNIQKEMKEIELLKSIEVDPRFYDYQD